MNQVLEYVKEEELRSVRAIKSAAWLGLVWFFVLAGNVLLLVTWVPHIRLFMMDFKTSISPFTLVTFDVAEILTSRFSLLVLVPLFLAVPGVLGWYAASASEKSISQARIRRFMWLLVIIGALALSYTLFTTLVPFIEIFEAIPGI
jgi:hypothetical protein